MQCGGADERGWFRLDTEDVQNQDGAVGPGAPPTGLTEEGQVKPFPTLILCRPRGAVRCGTTGVGLLEESAVTSAAWSPPLQLDWVDAIVEACLSVGGAAVAAAGKAACESRATGHSWTAVAVPPLVNGTQPAPAPPSCQPGLTYTDAGGAAVLWASPSEADAAMVLLGSQAACETEPTGSAWQAARLAGCTRRDTGSAVEAVSMAECAAMAGGRELFVEVQGPA
jgi:hypothetical protein